MGTDSPGRHKKGGTVSVQSAMEYLMTYGWAILIIAVILGVLFSLGVFNPMNYAPKVPAGNCHVFRPNGPGTSFNVNLVGTCSGFLPQYVAQFNGQNSKIVSTAVAGSTTALTVNVWVYPVTIASGYYGVIGQASALSNYWELEQEGNGYDFVVFSPYNSQWNPAILRTWSMLTVAYNSANVIVYVDGSEVSTFTNSANSIATNKSIYIGYTTDGSPYFYNGLISNAQIYNASLDANEISYLYNEGIGGAPVFLSHLVAWWPLNGDTKDYSGNGYHGIAYNLSFNGSWTNGYSQP